MPRIPDETALGERPIPQPSTGIVSYRATSGQEEVEGQAVAKFGDVVAKVANRYQDLFNTARAEDAFNKIRNAAIDLTVGEKGFVNVKGADAVTKPIFQDYTKRLQDASKLIESELTNNAQMEMYKKRYQVESTQYSEHLLRHRVQEGDAYAKQVFSSTNDTEIRGVTANWSSPNDVALSLERINANINREAERSGWSPEMIADAKLKAASIVHSSVIGQALASGNTAFAQQYYEANKVAIDTTTAKTLQKAVEDGEQKQLSNGYRSQFIASRNNPTALSQLEAEISKDGKLDDGRKNALLGPIASRRDVLQNRADLARDRVIRNAERQIGKLENMTLSGYEITAEQGLAVLNATKGTELEGQARNLIVSAAATREFRLSPPAQQEVMLNNLESQVRARPTPERVELLGKYKTIAERQRKTISDEPVAFAYRQGLAQSQQIDLSNPEQSSSQLIDQVGVARGMNRVYGAPFKPLMPDQLADVRARIDRASPEERMQWFGSLRRSLGGDAQGYSAIMAQIAPDDPVTAIAGEFSGKGRMEAAALLTRGQDILRPRQKADGKPDTGKLLPMPPEKDMRLEFDSTVRDAFSGNVQARAATYQAARAAYAALASDAGDKDTQVLDRDRWKRSIELVTGGIERYRGRNVPLPQGVGRSEFTAGISRRVDDLERSGLLPKGVTGSTLKDRPLEPVGDGRYAISYGPGTYAVDRNGRRIVLNFNIEPADVPLEEPPSEVEIAAAQVPYFGRVRAR